MNLPNNISNRYSLMSEVSIGESTSKKGVYFDEKTKRKVFVKIHTDSDALKREYDNQFLFYNKSKKGIINDISIPKPLDFIKTENYTAFIMEYMSGISIPDKNISLRIEAYFQILNFTNNFKLSKNKKIHLKTRYPAVQLLSVLYFLTKNIINYPSNFLLFIRSSLSIYSMLPQWISLAVDQINHGDINSTNILVSGKKLIYIDFKEAKLSHRFYDAQIALNSAWNIPNFQNELFDRYIKDFSLTDKEISLLRSLMALNLMQRLSIRYKNKNKERFYLKKLKNLTKSKVINPNNNTLIRILKNHGYDLKTNLNIDSSGRVNGQITNKSNENYFVKIAYDKNKYAYKSLVKESVITKHLSEVSNNYVVANNQFRLRVPQVIDTIREENYIILISRFIKGDILSGKSINTRAKVLWLTTDLVNELGKKCDTSTIESSLISYTKKSLLFSLPVRLVKASILSPLASFRLMKIFVKTLPLVSFEDYKNGLVHPDINTDNIIVKDKEVYLLDWEEAGWGISTYNSITPICVHWQNKSLREKLFKDIDKNQNEFSFALLAYRTIMLFNQRIKKESEKRKRDFMLLKFVESN